MGDLLVVQRLMYKRLHVASVLHHIDSKEQKSLPKTSSYHDTNQQPFHYIEDMGNLQMNFFLQNSPISALLLVSFVFIASSFPIESHRQLTRRQTSDRSENPLRTLKEGMEVLKKFTVRDNIIHVTEHV